MSMMPYTIEFENQTITVADGNVDLFEIVPADDRPVEIVGWDLTVLSEVGDAAEEMLRLQVIRGFTTSGSGGITPTAQGTKHNGTLGATVEAVNDSVATTGTTEVLYSGGMNVRIPHQVWFPEGFELGCVQPDTSIVLRLMAAVADDIVMSGTLFIREKL